MKEENIEIVRFRKTSQDKSGNSSYISSIGFKSFEEIDKEEEKEDS